MNAREFCGSTLQWLRIDQELRTPVLPVYPGENEQGIARIEGYFARPSSAGRWGIAGLWALALGAMFAMTALPGMPAVQRALIQQFGYGVLALGVGLVAVADATRRRHRARALVEIRAASAGPATAKAVAELHAAAVGADAWMLAEAGFAPEATAEASQRGVRCFEPGGEQFREVVVRVSVVVDPHPGQEERPAARRRRPAA